MARQADTRVETPLPPNGESGAEIPVCGTRFMADPSGALHWPDQNTLIVSDLHLEKGAARAVAGKRRLPPHDTRKTLVRLAAVIDRYDPDRVVVLGGSFGDAAQAKRLPRVDRERLCILRQGREWYWVGDDPDPALPDWLGGTSCPVLTVEGIRFRHAPGAASKSRQVAGGLNPCASLTRRGEQVRRKCFVASGSRLIVPAFGACPDGTDVLDQAISSLCPEGDFRLWMIGQDQVYPAAKSDLLGA